MKRRRQRKLREKKVAWRSSMGWWLCQTSANSSFFFSFLSLSFCSFFLSLCLFSFIPLACTTMTDSLKSSILFFSLLNLITFSGLFCPTKRHYFVQFGRPYLITWTPHFLQRHLCPLYYLEKSHALSVIRLLVVSTS